GAGPAARERGHDRREVGEPRCAQGSSRRPAHGGVSCACEGPRRRCQAPGAATRVKGEPMREPAVKNGRIKQSVAFWCFNAAGDKWDVDKTCQVAKDLGCQSVELVDPGQWGVLKKYGLICAMEPNGIPGAPFMKGFNNPRYHEEVIARTTKAIDACADAGFPNVIAFSGY